MHQGAYWGVVVNPAPSLTDAIHLFRRHRTRGHGRWIGMAVMCWCIMAAGVEAQVSSPIAVGTRVRAQIEGRASRPLIGSWLGLRDGHAEIREESGDVARLPMASVVRLERSVGMKRNGKTGALVGLVAGGIAGAVIGRTGDPYSDCGGNAGEGECRLWLWGGALLGAVGAGVGALIGQATQTDVWEGRSLDMMKGSSSRGVTVGWTVPVPR